MKYYNFYQIFISHTMIANTDKQRKYCLHEFKSIQVRKLYIIHQGQSQEEKALLDLFGAFLFTTHSSVITLHLLYCQSNYYKTYFEVHNLPSTMYALVLGVMYMYIQ